MTKLANLAEKLQKQASITRSEASIEERDQWLSSPLTKAVLAELESRVLQMVDDWAFGNFTGEGIEATAQLNAEALGRVGTYQECIELIASIGGTQVYDYSEGA